jgi:hypothetical protein
MAKSLMGLLFIRTGRLLMDDLEKQTAEEVVPTVEAKPEPPKQDSREYNFSIMRERAEQAERKARELEQALLAKQAQSENNELGVDDDGIVEGKHLKKYDKTVKDMKEELARTKKQLETFTTTTTETHLRTKFPDFDKIVTDENLEKLSREKPALYRSILANPDLKDKGETAYDAIQTFLQPGKFAAEDKRIAENKLKPRSSATAGSQSSDGPLARVGDFERRMLNKEQRDALWKEMQEAKALY